LKKYLPILTFIILLFAIPSLSKAAELKNYPKKVTVSVYKSASLTLKLNTVYQLLDNQSGTVTPLLPDTIMTIKNNGTNIVVSYSGTTLTSSSGFDVQEMDSDSTDPAKGTLSNGISYRGSFILKKNGTDVEVINYLDMEDYLKGVVPSEMPPSWHKEALKAQAIAARGYAATSMGLTNTPSSQVYQGLTGEDPRTNAAVKETEGLVAKFAGKPIMTFFYSTSGGRTANYADVWGGSGKGYYTSVADPYENSPYSSWSQTFSASAILKAFGYTDSLTKLYDITLQKTGANGEVTGVTVKTSAGDKTKTGTESDIRKLFAVSDASHYNQLNSNWFNMTVLKGQPQLALTVQTASSTESLSTLKGQVVQTASGQTTLADDNVSIQTGDGVISSEADPVEITSVTLNGKGWGHRIGMSQYGAKGMAEHGWSAAKIIEYYFQGTTVLQ
jgi:stage II sporulation protein D